MSEVHGWRRALCGCVVACLCAVPFASAQQGTQPEETTREQMERFKREKGAGSDEPFEGLKAEAEREMQRQREAAIGGSPDEVRSEEESGQGSSLEEYRALEREMLDDRLAAMATWGASGCFLEEPDWSGQDDFIKHRKLTQDDFLSKNEQKVEFAVKVPGARAAAYVALRLSCVVKTKLTAPRDDRHQVGITHVRYFALFSRNESYWSPETDPENTYLLGHEQLHFDIAEAFARHLTSLEDEIRTRVDGEGETPEQAIGQLQLSWGQHMKLVQQDLEMIEVEYDRQTRHGTLPERQTEWFWRVQDGFAAISKGMRLESLEGLN
jgi:hypothetical protein